MCDIGVEIWIIVCDMLKSLGVKHLVGEKKTLEMFKVRTGMIKGL